MKADVCIVVNKNGLFKGGYISYDSQKKDMFNNDIIQYSSLFSGFYTFLKQRMNNNNNNEIVINIDNKILILKTIEDNVEIHSYGIQPTTFERIEQIVRQYIDKINKSNGEVLSDLSEEIKEVIENYNNSLETDAKEINNTLEKIENYLK